MKKQKQIIALLFILTVFGLFTGNAAAQTDEQKCNCVLFARSRVPALPSGLTSWTGKLSVINHLFPKVGTVAVIDVGNDTGHVAVVENVTVASDGGLRVSIVESNYSRCQITRRSGTMEALKIRGFFDPAYSSASSFPRVDWVSSTSGRAGQTLFVTFNGTGFDPNSLRAVVMGGGCGTFNSCVVPTNVITNRSSTRATVPMVINRSGPYTVYLFNSNSGKSANGIRIDIR